MALSLLALVLAAAPVFAGDEKRELGPHEHGHGVLNIAIEKSRVAMDLDVPGMDIVGFEHKPASGSDKEMAKKAEAVLANPLSLFKVPDSAGCKATEVKVAVETEGADEDNANKNETAAKPQPGGKEEKHEGHNDYNVSYVLECAKPSEIKSIEFGYFKSFAGAEALTVNVISEKAQNSYEVTREKPRLDLGGTM